VSEEPRIFGDMRRIARGGAIVLLASVFGNGIGYVYSVFLARNLGPTTFGVYALGLTIFNVLLLVAPLGMETGVVKYVSQFLGSQKRADAERTIVQVVGLVLVSSLVIGVCLALMSKTIAISVYGKAELASALPLFAVALPIAALSSILLDVVRSFQLVRYTVFVKFLWEPCGKFLLSACLLWAGFGFAGVLAALIATAAVGLVIALTATVRIGAIGRDVSAPFSADGMRALLLFCLPLTVSNCFGVIAPRSDMLILGYWVSAEQLGVYSVVCQTASILALVLGAFNTLCAPLIGDISATRDLHRLQTLYQAVARWTTMCTVSLFCLIAIFGEEILAIFGRTFSAGWTCMVILALGQVSYSAVGLAGTILLMFGHSRQIMGNTIVLALFLVGSNLLLVPHWGIIGAAVAVAISTTAIGVINVRQVWSRYRIHPFTVGVVKPIVAGAVAAGITWTLKARLAASEYPILIASMGTIYVLCLAMLRFDETDREIFAPIMARLRPARRLLG
jgi:O-antigen/teichoic acid export membrane protein